MVLFNYMRCLQINCNEFDDEQGRLPDGRDVAVKKLNGRQTTQAAEEFLTEVKLLTSVRHRNLVRLLGCCTRGHERLLVYEFMSNNSLHKHLFGRLLSSILFFSRFKLFLKICVLF
jgi:serine/threonine protein kinase